MKTAAKVGLLAAAYVGAFLVATLVVGVYVAWTDGPDRQTYAAMYDFGDSLLFLAALAVSAAAVVYAIGRTASGAPLGEWAGLATLRILVAPICVLGFAVSGLLAPTRAPRIALLMATGIDAAAFAYVVLTWTRVA